MIIGQVIGLKAYHAESLIMNFAETKPISTYVFAFAAGILRI